MKIRSGFVSNSSSTSFVYLFPDNFTADSIDWSKHHDMFKQVDVDEDGQKVVIEVGVKSAKKVINTLLATGSLWDEEVRETTDTYDDMITIVHEVLAEYEIATINGPSDSGQMVVADPKKVKKILA